MATEGGGTIRPLIERLATEPKRFDVRQALRILERRREEQEEAGRDDADTDRGAVDFRANLSLAFPTGDIESVRFGAEGPDGRPVMTVNFMGLGGVLGPMPPPYTEFILSSARREPRVTAPGDFLDLFNNRLIWLALESAKRFRVALEGADPAQSSLARFLKAVIGLGTPRLEPLLHLRRGSLAPALLPLAALVHQKPVSAHAVERAVATHFGRPDPLPVRLVPLQGGWLELPAEEWTVLGAGGRNQVLSDNAIAGRRVWDQAAGIEIVLGPMDFDRAFAFLPGGAACAELGALMEVMLAGEFDIRVRLEIRPAIVPASRIALGARLGQNTRLGGGAHRQGAARPGSPIRTMRLGWTSWLGRGGQAGTRPTTAFRLPAAQLGVRAAP